MKKRNPSHDTRIRIRDVVARLSEQLDNVGSMAGSAEFGGNDAWLLKGRWPVADGKTSVFLYAGDDFYKGRQTDFSIFKRTNWDGEYEDEEIAHGSLVKLLPKARRLAR
jgi:hypothetical protein